MTLIFQVNDPATSPQSILAYIQALIIDSIALPVEDSINTRALAHECTWVHKYSKVKSKQFTYPCRNFPAEKPSLSSSQKSHRFVPPIRQFSYRSDLQ